MLALGFGAANSLWEIMYKKLVLYSTTLKGNKTECFTDFKIGKIKLAPHLDIDDFSVLDISPSFVRQLLLQEPSTLKSNRVPIYVCKCCGDLSCGATTVKVERTEESFIWSDFRRESDYEDGWSQSDYMSRTGPFEFEKENYMSTLQPYTIKTKRSNNLS